MVTKRIRSRHQSWYFQGWTRFWCLAYRNIKIERPIFESSHTFEVKSELISKVEENLRTIEEYTSNKIATASNLRKK